MSNDWEQRTKILNGRRITYWYNEKANMAVMEKSELIHQEEIEIAPIQQEKTEVDDASNNQSNQ